MVVVYLDTDPILRYLTQDNPGQAARSKALFEQAGRGEVTLYLSEVVVLEVVNVLSSRVTYNLPRPEIKRHLENVFSLPGFTIPRKQTYRRALELWVQTSAVRDFADALHVAHMERLKISTIVSFDADLDRFSGITRQAP